MIRRAAAIVVALMINPVLLYAQDTALTVTVPSADVYKGPTNVTPVIGHVPEGTVLPIARNLGSWVRIAWPDAPEGIGYVHVTMGRIGPARSEVAAAPGGTRTASTTTTTQRPIPPPTRQPVGVRVPPQAPGTERSAPRVQGTVSPASHMLGVGALVGYTRSIGATGRLWPNNHLGVQFSLTRNTFTDELSSSDQVTTTQFEPAVMYGLFDRVTDYIWLRPYVGSALSFQWHHETALQPVSDNGIGFRVFGGSEFMFASAPQFGLSADAGYRRLQEITPGFDTSRLSIAIAGHWYIR